MFKTRLISGIVLVLAALLTISGGGLVSVSYTHLDVYKRQAYDGGYAIGAFNVNNMEIVQGITEAAGELNSPLILQVSAGARKYANHTYLVKLVEAALIENDIPRNFLLLESK